MTRDELNRIKAVDLPFITEVEVLENGIIEVEHMWVTYRYESFEEALADTEEESEWFFRWLEQPDRWWAEDILERWTFFKSTIKDYTVGDYGQPDCWLECDWRLSEDCSEITFKAKGNDSRLITKKKIFKAAIPAEIQEQLIQWKNNNKKKPSGSGNDYRRIGEIK